QYLSGGLLLLLGGYLWWSGKNHDEGDDEGARARQLIHARGLALLGLVLSISVDELAIGFSFGLDPGLAEPSSIIAAIAIQALIVSQLGLWLGDRISETLREWAERLVGPLLILIGLLPLAKKLIRIDLVPPRGVAIASVLMIILASAIVYRRFT